MKRRRPRRPSPALVIACLALFVALGGTVMAATKIDGRTIRVKSLPGNRLAPRSVPGNRIVPGSLKGTQIDLGSLAQVPSAAHAESADTARRAQTATAADHAADATTVNGRSVGCPELTREFAGACWDLRARTPAATAPEAAAACAATGGELPQLLPLIAFDSQPGVSSVPSAEWTNNARVDGSGIYVVATLENGVTPRPFDPSEPHQYRCVVPLLH
jgi:hypothetical protein